MAICVSCSISDSGFRPRMAGPLVAPGAALDLFDAVARLKKRKLRVLRVSHWLNPPR